MGAATLRLCWLRGLRYGEVNFELELAPFNGGVRPVLLMASTDWFGIWFGCFLLGFVVYLLLALITLRLVKEMPMKLILLGLVTVVIATWFGALPHNPGINSREMQLNLSALVSNQGSAVLGRTGVILVLAGLAGYLLRGAERPEKPDNQQESK